MTQHEVSISDEQATTRTQDRLDRTDGTGTAGRRPEQGASAVGGDVPGTQGTGTTSTAQRRDRPPRLTRRCVAVDLETTGLDTQTAFPVEIAAVEALPDDPGVYGTIQAFVPFHERAQINEASADALAVNRYFERRLFAKMSTVTATAAEIDKLVTLLDGATLVGANPAYDAAILWQYLRERTDLDSPPWHFRLYDVETATAAALGLDAIPGLAKCADLWNIDTDPTQLHTAAGDAFLTADVFTAVYTAHRPRTAPVDDDFDAFLPARG